MNEHQELISLEKEVKQLTLIRNARLRRLNELKRKHNCKIGNRWNIDANGDIVSSDEILQPAQS